VDLGKKAAYLKGLIDGLSIDETTKEGRIITLMADILEDTALIIEDLQEQIDEIIEVVDIMDRDLGELESDFYDEDYYDDDEDDEYDFFEDDLYEVTCPSCKDTIYLNEDMLDEGSMDCPNCEEFLEFDVDFDDWEEDEE